MLAGCGSSGPSPTQQPSHRSGPELQSIFEAVSALIAAPAHTLDELKRLGVDRIRLDMTWASLAPALTARRRPAGFDATDPASYPRAGWAIYDLVLRDAEARGIGVDLTIGGPVPVWAKGTGEPPGTHRPVWKPNAAEFGSFVAAVGKRYSGRYRPAGASSPLPRIGFWSIWNEPNYGYDLAPQAIEHSTVEVSPMLYRGLLDAAWTALHATGHGGDTILFGETAPRGITTGDNPGNFSGMVPLRFVRALYCVDTALKPLQGQAATVRGCPSTTADSRQFRRLHPALFDASGFSDHPYPEGEASPTVRTPDEPDYADLASLPKLEHTLDAAKANYGSSPTVPIYSTEFGYQTDPPEPYHLSPTRAAGYLNWSEYISWRDPRIRSYDQYLLIDPASSTGSSFDTGLKFANGTPKATYAAFRMPLFLPASTQSPGRQLEVWGCVRPVHAHHADTSATLQFAAGSSTRFRTLRVLRITDANGYFDVTQRFPRSGTVRVALRYPNSGGEIYSRSVAVTVHR